MGFCIDPSDDISEIEGYQSALSEATLPTTGESKIQID